MYHYVSKVMTNLIIKILPTLVIIGIKLQSWTKLLRHNSLFADAIYVQNWLKLNFLPTVMSDIEANPKLKPT